MDYYEIWCNLRNSREDRQFCSAVCAYLQALQAERLIEGFRLTRRKLGFGPPELGEFHISIQTRNLRQLEDCFQRVASWAPEIAALHADVFTRVADAKFGLYRDFPDEFVNP